MPKSKEEKDIPIKYQPEFEIQTDVNTNFVEALNKKIGSDVSEYFFIGQRKLKWLRTMSPMFDYICGGGLPIGKWVEIHGENDTGKTFLTLVTIAGISQMRKHVLYLDMEGKLDLDLLESLNADMNYIHIAIAPTAEVMLDIINSALNMPFDTQPSVIVIDSLVAAPTTEEVESDMKGRTFSSSSLLWTRFVRMVTYDLAKSNCTLIGINQMRDNVGGGKYDPDKKPAGPNSIQHKPAIRIKTHRVYTDDDGMILSYKCVKNHLAKTHDTKTSQENEKLKFGTYVYYYPHTHIDRSAELVELANRYNLFTKQDGSEWPNFNSSACLNGLDLGRGRGNVIEYLDANPEYREQVFAEAVYEAIANDRLTKKDTLTYMESTYEEDDVIVDIEPDVEVTL